MKTKHVLFASCLSLTLHNVTAQWVLPGNAVTSTFSYLGCNGLSTVPLVLPYHQVFNFPPLLS